MKPVLTGTTRFRPHGVPVVPRVRRMAPVRRVPVVSVAPLEGRVQRLDRRGPYGLWPTAQPGAEPGAQLGAVGQAGQRVVAGAVGELQLVPLALLDVLDVREQEPGSVGGVGDDGVAQRDPYIRAVAAAQAQLGAAPSAEVRSRVPMSSGWTRSEKE